MMNGEQLGAVVRGIVQALGGYFVGQGLIDSETLIVVGGAIATLVATIYSMYIKRD